MDEEKKVIQIPQTYNEIYSFICENKYKISNDWSLLFEILKVLDKLLNEISYMSELHKDTKIIVESMRIQQDILIKEFRSSITFDKLLFMAENDALDRFFSIVKASSQSIQFLDGLNFNVKSKDPLTKKEKANYDAPKSVQILPEKYIEVSEENNTNTSIQKISSKIESLGKIEYFTLICDPNSYSKTVLNGFNLALALRQKMVSMKMLEDTLYVVPYDDEITGVDHSVLELTMSQYEVVRQKFYGK